jgi:hypothetical protein
MLSLLVPVSRVINDNCHYYYKETPSTLTNNFISLGEKCFVCQLLQFYLKVLNKKAIASSLKLDLFVSKCLRLVTNENLHSVTNN